ncbi:phosphoglycerate dehydrogenase [Rhodococcoides fascians]|uniref:phosphoglycerate dehydrogenase n=1 Tax=Rhodococcoides fascians TaxID=1828 RepID=UPI000561EC45|nr:MULTISPECIES: phosphoglycerate dehydrogenase [Rhodococcus]OZF04747.1 hydroxyacid dehydrogenase [Rhodococcus sp. 15-1189-1-1a]OZF19012.1 hydroxyacid dehydrogenase [Rhodococcus sp. 14-2686-1-2]
MARILITTDYLEPGDDVDRLLRGRGHTTVHSPSRGPRPPGEMASLLSVADAALVAGEPITAEMIDAAPDLTVIARSGVGYDTIDVDAASRRGIAVCNTPGANSNAVAEMAFMLVSMCARRVGETIAGVASGGWPRHDTVELRGSTLGIVGFGPSGSRLAELAACFGMRVLVHTSYPDATRPVQYCGLDEVLRESDFVSLHVRPTAGNVHMIGVRELAIMKSTASLINTARGSLVDEDALADAVHSGVIAGAGLDVVDIEPLPAGSALRELPSVVVTSHLAGQTAQARAVASRSAAEDILRVLDGDEPLSRVDLA